MTETLGIAVDKRSDIREEELTKLDMTPALFPIMAWSAIVVVRFPYRGEIGRAHV